MGDPRKSAGRGPMTQGERALALGYDSTAEGPEGERARALGYDSTDETPWTGEGLGLTDLPEGSLLIASDALRDDADDRPPGKGPAGEG